MAHPSKVIGSVQRALDILDLFGEARLELGTTEIARGLGLHKSTANSLIGTLLVNGYLDQDPKTRKYRLGLKLVERAAAVLSRLEIRQTALPHLEALRSAFDETVNLGVLDRAEVMYVERLPSSRVLSMRSEIGRRTLAHSAALGKAILAYLPAPVVARHLELYGLPRLTEHTITDPDRFQAELANTRERGYAVDDEENEEGGRCIAAPLFDYTGYPIAAVSISAPLARLPHELVPDHGRRVRAIADQISAKLGYMPAARAVVPLVAPVVPRSIDMQPA